MEPFEYKEHVLEVRRTYWPGNVVKLYCGFVDGCRVRESGAKYGWISGFDPEKVKARLMEAVDVGALCDRAG